MERGLLVLVVFANFLFLLSDAERPGAAPPRPVGVELLADDLGSAANTPPSVAAPPMPIVEGFVEPEESSEDEQSRVPVKKPHADPDKDLAELREHFEPAQGPIRKALDQMRVSDNKARWMAKNWMDTSHEAIQAASHVLHRATNDAETVLYKDALRMDQAVKGNFLTETAKMDALSLDPQAKAQIIQEQGDGIHTILPPEQSEDMVGKTIRINGEYHGINQDMVHGSRGVIVSYVHSQHKFRVKLIHNPKAKAFMPVLSTHQFEIVPGEELDGLEVDDEEREKDEAQEATNDEFTTKMEQFGEKEVRIDHLPAHLLDTLKDVGKAPDALVHHTAKIINYRHDGEMPEFQVQLDGEAEDGDGDEMRPWLVLDRDIYLVPDLKGQTVHVSKSHEGDPDEAAFHPGVHADGVVQDWHSEEGGYYDVKIPEHIVKAKPEEIRRHRGNWNEQDEYVGEGAASKVSAVERALGSQAAEAAQTGQEAIAAGSEMPPSTPLAPTLGAQSSIVPLAATPGAQSSAAESEELSEPSESGAEVVSKSAKTI